jgi:hypothetical protein
MKPLLPVLVLFALSISANAHRLDEYLQAARLGVSLNQVELSLDLTPGADMAEEFLKTIDPQASPGVSPAAGQRYARRVMNDLRLDVDGKREPLKLISAAFPERAELRAGEGSIHLHAVAKLSTLKPGRHELHFRNHHLPGFSVYLVNALVPVNPAIHLLRQTRDEPQKDYTLSFEVARAEK